jgi:hypothetical protein
VSLIDTIGRITRGSFADTFEKEKRRARDHDASRTDANAS